MTSRLERAARWADTTQLSDGYTGQLLWKAQISSYIDNQMDGAISKRRVISYAPGLALPPRRVVSWGTPPHDELWIVGDELGDYWKGGPIRISAATKKVTGLYNVAHAGELFTGGTNIYGQLIFLKDVNDQLVTSLYSPQFQLYFAAGEPVHQGYVVTTDDLRYLHIRSIYPVLDGFICTEADDLGYDAKQTVELRSKSGTYDVVSGQYPTVTTVVDCIELDYFKLYEKENPLVAGMQPGDLTLLMAIKPDQGAQVFLHDRLWRIVGVQASTGGGWRAHVRHA